MNMLSACLTFCLMVLLQVISACGCSLGTIRECSASEIIVKFKPDSLWEGRKLSILRAHGARSIRGAYKDLFKIIEVPEGASHAVIQALQKIPT